MYFPMASSPGQYLCAKDSLTIVTGCALASSASVKLRPFSSGTFSTRRYPESIKRSEACSYSPGFAFLPAMVKLVKKSLP